MSSGGRDSGTVGAVGHYSVFAFEILHKDATLITQAVNAWLQDNLADVDGNILHYRIQINSRHVMLALASMSHHADT